MTNIHKFQFVPKRKMKTKTNIHNFYRSWESFKKIIGSFVFLFCTSSHVKDNTTVDSCVMLMIKIQACTCIQMH